MFEVILTSVYLGYFGILFLFIKIISENITEDTRTREPTTQIENNNLNMIIKNNRFNLDNYKKNEQFDHKIKKWHRKLKGIKFKEYIEIYEIPNRYELDKNILWWSFDDFCYFMEINSKENDNII